MRAYLDLIPYGFCDASFDGYGEEGIQVVLPADIVMEDDYSLALYNCDEKSVYPVNSKETIPYKIFEQINSSSSFLYICMIYRVDNVWKAIYLRNMSLKIPGACTREVYDKRYLYGDPISDGLGRMILPHYRTDKLLAVELCDEESMIFYNQLQNEVIFESQEEDAICIHTKCKQIEGNYIGLAQKACREENILEYVKYDEDKNHSYMSFVCDTKTIFNTKEYDVVWMQQGKYYYAPLMKSEEKPVAHLEKLSADKEDGIILGVVYDSLKYGKCINVELMQSVKVWEPAQNYVLNDNVCEYEENRCVLTIKINSKKLLLDFGSWFVQITTQIDNKKYELPVNILENPNIKEFYDYEDSKRKITFKCKDDCFCINRVYGHNAMFKKNRQMEDADITSLEDFLNVPGIEPAGDMHAEYIETDEGLKIKLYQNMDGIKEARLVMYHSQGLGVLSVSEIPVHDGIVDEFDVKIPDIDHDGKFDKPINNVWFRVCIALWDKNGIYFACLKDYDATLEYSENGHIYDRRSLYYSPLGECAVSGIDMTALPYYADNGRLSMKYVRAAHLYRSQFTNELLGVKIKHDMMTVKIKCQNCGVDYKGVLMEYRNVKEEDAENYFIPYTSLKAEKDYLIMTTHIDMKKYFMRMLYWDIRCAFEVNGETYTVSCHSNDERFLGKFKGVFVDRTYPNDNSILFPYATDNHSVALMHRESCPQDHWPFRLKEKLAVSIYKLFKRHWDSKNIYLIFEKYCTMAQDNGFFFFKYCMEADVEASFPGEIRYVIDSKQADWQKVLPYKKHVIKYLSLKHMIYLQACRLMISTDTKGHAYVWRSMGSKIKEISYRKSLVFLQHGVTAFKRGHFERGTNVGCECFITTSQFEHDIIHDYLGYPESEIPITGFARWDVLHDKSEGHREILMMPTWRTWLDDAENDVFAESDYCKNYMALLNDPKLDAILKQYDVTLNFYLHPKFRKFITEFSVVSDHIRLIPFGEAPLNELMMECNLLITDFSSVAWDVYYMNKPVLFYHFDLEDAYKTLGFYIDMKNDIFGDRAEKPEELMNLIIEYIENGFAMKEEFTKDREKYFAFVDDNNSERIWKAIRDREW